MASPSKSPNKCQLLDTERTAIAQAQSEILAAHARLQGMLQMIVANHKLPTVPGGWMLAADGQSLVPSLPQGAVSNESSN